MVFSQSLVKRRTIERHSSLYLATPYSLISLALEIPSFFFISFSTGSPWQSQPQFL